jgi:hypothetical protein
VFADWLGEHGKEDEELRLRLALDREPCPSSGEKMWEWWEFQEGSDYTFLHDWELESELFRRLYAKKQNIGLARVCRYRRRQTAIFDLVRSCVF